MTMRNDATYYVGGIGGFDFDTFVKAMKAKYDTFDGLIRNVKLLPEVKSFFQEYWDTIVPLTFQEAISERNAEKRRGLFTCINPSEFFANMSDDMEMVDRQTISRKNMRWDQNNQHYFEDLNETYELYLLDRQKIFPEKLSYHSKLAMVRCWCPSTDREYWLFVDERESRSDGHSWSKEGRQYDAIKAIASTFRIREINPKAIYRHGDVVIVEKWGDERDEELHWGHRPLTKEQYMNIIVSQT